MKSKFRRVALIGKYQTASAAALLTESHKVLQDIALFLQKQHCEVVLESETATNTGMTALVMPDGRVEAVLPAFEAGALHVAVRGYQGLTPYARWGNWPAVAAALAVLGLAALRRRG